MNDSPTMASVVFDELRALLEVCWEAHARVEADDLRRAAAHADAHHWFRVPGTLRGVLDGLELIPASSNRKSTVRIRRSRRWLPCSGD